MGRHRLALFDHPVFKIKLFADDLECLIENLDRVLVCAGSYGQVDHALLFGFQVNSHGRLHFRVHPYPTRPSAPRQDTIWSYRPKRVAAFPGARHPGFSSRAPSGNRIASLTHPISWRSSPLEWEIRNSNAIL